MKEFDLAYQVDLARDYADAVLAEYISYFYKNKIDRTKESENRFVKIYYELYDIQQNKIYDCKTQKDFEIMKQYILKAKKYLEENKEE